jgi:hypothetical protein
MPSSGIFTLTLRFEHLESASVSHSVVSLCYVFCVCYGAGF